MSPGHGEVLSRSQTTAWTQSASRSQSPAVSHRVWRRHGLAVLAQKHDEVCVEDAGLIRCCFHVEQIQSHRHDLRGQQHGALNVRDVLAPQNDSRIARLLFLKQREAAEAPSSIGRSASSPARGAWSTAASGGGTVERWRLSAKSSPPAVPTARYDRCQRCIFGAFASASAWTSHGVENGSQWMEPETFAAPK